MFELLLNNSPWECGLALHFWIVIRFIFFYFSLAWTVVEMFFMNYVTRSLWRNAFISIHFLTCLKSHQWTRISIEIDTFRIKIQIKIHFQLGHHFSHGENTQNTFTTYIAIVLNDFAIKHDITCANELRMSQLTFELMNDSVKHREASCKARDENSTSVAFLAANDKIEALNFKMVLHVKRELNFIVLFFWRVFNRSQLNQFFWSISKIRKKVKYQFR